MARLKRIPTKAWEKYSQIINEFMENDVGKQKILWLNRIDQMLPYGEDSGNEYDIKPIEGLISYNYIRAWPSHKNTVTGELDGVNEVLYISRDYLNNRGYLTQDGYWDFDWVQDRFIINGKVYIPAGDTEVAQASDKPLLFFLVLKRETPEKSRELIDTTRQIVSTYQDKTSLYDEIKSVFKF